jgi:hypothetical protein
VALIVGGLVLAVGWIVSGSGGSDIPGTTATTAAVADPDTVLACVEVLEEPCKAVAATLGVSARTWTPGSPAPDRGVIVAPAAELTDGMTAGPVVATSPVVIAGWLQRTQPLEVHCSDVVDIACVAGAFGQPWASLGGSEAWGDFKIGLADPTRSEAGMAAWALLAPSMPASGFSNSLRIDESSDAALMKSVVLFGPSRADVFITTEVAVASQFDNAIASSKGRFQVYYPSSGPWVEYVTVAFGRTGTRLAEDLAGSDAGDAFASAGLRPVSGGAGVLPDWTSQPGTQVPGPDPTTRATLTKVWEDLT